MTGELAIGVASGSYPDLRQTPLRDEFLQELELHTSNASRHTVACFASRANRLLRAMALSLCALSGGALAQNAPYTPPPSPRVKLNFDWNWKFIREDVPGAEAPGFDDSAWTTVSTPNTYNDVDSFRQIISHSGGDRGTYKGLAWYRKHFKLPARFAAGRVFLEFEGMRQAGDI
ncbi:MAG: hypothetical protein ACLQKA_18775, partial [Bryobacteraceae bacterium]